MKFSSDVFGTITGVRFYKSAANTGTHIGSLWTADGAAAGAGDVHRRDRLGLADGDVLAARSRCMPDTTYVASYYAPSGHYAATPRLLLPRARARPERRRRSPTARRCTRCATPARRQRRLQLRLREHVPDQLLRRCQLLGRRDVPVDPRAGHGDGRSAAPAAGPRRTCPGRAGDGRPVTSYKVTPYIGSDRADAARPSPASPPATNTTMTGLTPGTTYTFRVQAINPNGAGPLSAASGPVTPLNPVVPVGAARRDRAAGVGSPRASPGRRRRATATARSPATWSRRTSATTAQTPVARPAHRVQHHRHRADERDGVHVPGPGRQRRRRGHGRRAPAGHAAGDASSSSTSAGRRQRRPRRGRARREVPPEVSGQITGVRFYKSAANTGTHVGSLWT